MSPNKTSSSLSLHKRECRTAVGQETNLKASAKTGIQVVGALCLTLQTGRASRRMPLVVRTVLIRSEPNGRICLSRQLFVILTWRRVGLNRQSAGWTRLVAATDDSRGAWLDE